MWCCMLPIEGKGGQFPYPSAFESTVTKTETVREWKSKLLALHDL